MFQGGVNLSTPIVLTTVLDGVTLILDFYALGKQTLATLGTTTTNDISTVLGGHAGTESELTLAAALGRLISSLAHNVKKVLLNYGIQCHLPRRVKHDRTDRIPILIVLSIRQTVVLAFFLAGITLLCVVND